MSEGSPSDRELAIGQVPNRGGLFAANPIERLIAQLQERSRANEQINICEGVFSEELAWNFNGEVKYLNECTKEELLHVCQVLVKKVSTVSPDQCRIQYV